MERQEGSVKVLGYPLSAFCMRVYIALNEKGVPYEVLEEEFMKKSQLLLQSNPIHKTIPVLLHNGNPILESSIIIEYIDDMWPSPPLFNPPSPYNRAMHRFWTDFINKKFFDAGLRIFRSPLGEVQDGAVRDMVESYKMLEKALEDMACGKPFFGGESIGLVDIAFAPFIPWFKTYETMGKFKLPGEEECPLLSAWAKKVSEVPSVKKTLPDPDKVLDFANCLKKGLQNISPK